MKKVFILEDDPRRMELFYQKVAGPEVTIYHSEHVPGAKALLEEHTFDLLLLDHDLGGQQYVSAEEENSGSGLVRYLKADESGKHTKTPVIIHSFNIPRAVEMVKSLKECGFEVAVQRTFGPVVFSMAAQLLRGA